MLGQSAANSHHPSLDRLVASFPNQRVSALHCIALPSPAAPQKLIVSLSERSPCIFSIRGNRRAKYLALAGLSKPAPINSTENGRLNCSVCQRCRLESHIKTQVWKLALEVVVDIV